jgi:TonB family protein
LIRDLLDRIRAARRYPELARRREVEGTVVVGFSVGRDGRAHDLRVVRGADPLLDQAAREAVERAAPLPVLDGPVEVDVEFQLTGE